MCQWCLFPPRCKVTFELVDGASTTFALGDETNGFPMEIWQNGYMGTFEQSFTFARDLRCLHRWVALHRNIGLPRRCQLTGLGRRAAYWRGEPTCLWEHTRFPTSLPATKLSGPSLEQTGDLRCNHVGGVLSAAKLARASPCIIADAHSTNTPKPILRHPHTSKRLRPSVQRQEGEVAVRLDAACGTLEEPMWHEDLRCATVIIDFWYIQWPGTRMRRPIILPSPYWMAVRAGDYAR
ncbi:hypothetical protein K458DRAFT_15419 [Lentithecium fluviatile CBS 122367]|uniref:Uncharacterized protein n=1 Tax=Lentithecium fluviatile CBS 122367 TaxID=1168545 RepID=A0A6G1J604_9PLEO|nr:hypothetical protein K458DRAFT_15419 [Lentithecium fluviatile CBS 122367]